MAITTCELHLQRAPPPPPPKTAKHTATFPLHHAALKTTQKAPTSLLPTEPDRVESGENTAPSGQTTTSFSQNSSFERVSAGKGQTWTVKGKGAGRGGGSITLWEAENEGAQTQYWCWRWAMFMSLTEAALSIPPAHPSPPCPNPLPCTHSLPVCLETESRGWLAGCLVTEKSRNREEDRGESDTARGWAKIKKKKKEERKSGVGGGEGGTQWQGLCFGNVDEAGTFSV